jgi:hypothetical protein
LLGGTRRLIFSIREAQDDDDDDDNNNNNNNFIDTNLSCYCKIQAIINNNNNNNNNNNF